MERPLVQHGASTLMVSLPKKWLDQQRLHKGNAIFLTVLPDKIILTPSSRKNESLETTVHFSKDDYEEVRAVLGTLYRRGYQKVIVTFDHPRSMYFIQLITDALLGFEIIEQSEKKCVIKNITPELSIDIEEMLNKVVNIIKTEFLLVRDYLSQGSKGKDHEIRRLRDDCWKYRNVVYIHLKDTLLFSAYDNYIMVHLFEYNASFLYWLYRSFDQSNLKNVSPSFLKVYDQIVDYFKESIIRMKRKDKDYIEYIMTGRETLLKLCEEYVLKKAPDRFLILYLSMLIQNIHNPKSLIV